MELIVIRHARPLRIKRDGPGDPERANAGLGADPELTDVGHAQAASLAEWLSVESIDAVYVSPMARARQTAAPLEERLGLVATVDDRIKEYDHTSSEYVPIEEVKKDREKWRAWVAQNQAEDRSAFADTVMAGIDDIIAANPGRRVAVVCHGGVINIVAARILGLGDEMFFNPHYASINRFMAASSGERSVLSLNDHGHLRTNPELVLY